MADDYPQLMKCFKTCSQDTAIYFMPGNRDFLFDEAQATTWGLGYIDDPCVIHIANQPILLMHGDLLCTEDTSYQRLRSLLRHPSLISIFNQLPLSVRHFVGKCLRKRSQKETSKKTAKSMQATPSAIKQYISNYNCSSLLFGHVHQHSCREIKEGHQTAIALSMSSWDDSDNFVIADYHLQRSGHILQYHQSAD